MADLCCAADPPLSVKQHKSFATPASALQRSGPLSSGNNLVMEIRKNVEMSRYEIVDGDQLVGVCDYLEQGDIVTMPHTEINPARRGQGLAAQLVRGALDDIAASGRHVVPTCWYVADFMRANREYTELFAA
ncbi:MAG: N-acetyltransferase [Frankiaceae bacterium]|nr:N-acetyltransferase [Frankiaceae bacterium]